MMRMMYIRMIYTNDTYIIYNIYIYINIYYIHIYSIYYMCVRPSGLTITSGVRPSTARSPLRHFRLDQRSGEQRLRWSLATRLKFHGGTGRGPVVSKVDANK